MSPPRRSTVGGDLGWIGRLTQWIAAWISLGPCFGQTRRLAAHQPKNGTAVGVGLLEVQVPEGIGED